MFDTEEAEVEKLERQLFSSPPPPCSGGQFNTTPLNSILSPRIYPDLDNGGESTDGYCTPMGTPATEAHIPKTQSDINLTRVS